MSNNQTLFLSLGFADIAIHFSNSIIADKALNHLFLKKQSTNTIVGTIQYHKEKNIPHFTHPSCQPNVVYIKEDELENNQKRILLRVFDQYTIILENQDKNITILYQPDTPIHLLLDDVLQAALYYVLEKMGGFLLHGSCVVSNQTAIAILGISGAGKSSTAFNLTRFGFNCYADDAVIVIQHDDQLVVSPFTREISVRPLTFGLLKQHGANINDYRKEGEKYFFRPTINEQSNAHLKYICFAEVSGEKDTKFIFLDKEQCLKKLLDEPKHFTFMGRHAASIYSKTLSEYVPVPIVAKLGSDFNKQGEAFKSIFTGCYSPIQKTRFLSKHTGRSKKIEILRDAWLKDITEIPFEDIIPMLQDYDLKVLKLAFSFFQTIPIGKLEPIEWEKKPNLESIESIETFEAKWINADAWLNGCKKLVEQSYTEVFNKFAYPWIQSAPFIFPFLAYATSNHNEKSQLIHDAWAQYKLNTTQKETEKQSNRLYVPFFLSEISAINEIFYNDMTRLKGDLQWVIIPVITDQADSLSSLVAFIQLAKKNGTTVLLSRYFPLCSLDNTTAKLLIGMNALELSDDSDQKTIYLPKDNRKADISHINEICHMEINMKWIDKPYKICSSCGHYPLGLCRGGFFQTFTKENN